MPVVITWPVCRRRKGVQLSACALAVGVCAVILAGCERGWHSSAVSSTADAHGAPRTANAHKVSSTANAHGASRTANAHPVPSTANAHAPSSAANAYPVSSTENASIATRPRLRKPVPLPDRALLSPQPEPDCEFKTTEPKTEERMKLDYERQCYRHAEMIVRNRLELLQSYLDKTINAVKQVPELDGSGAP